MRPWKSHQDREEEVCRGNAYLITTGTHNALLLTQLSSLIWSAVEYHLKHSLITHL